MDQSIAYAEADFAETDQAFVERFAELFGADYFGAVMDLGCGPGNITFRMANKFPDSAVTGIDGSGSMLDIARQRMAMPDYPSDNVRFVESLVTPDLGIQSDGIVSNSLLHHLHDPGMLWESIKAVANSSCCVLVRDLRRPESVDDAQRIVDTYADDAPEVLKMDFYNSLLAAFTPQEVEQQLEAAGLVSLIVSPIGDRHLEIQGRL